MHFAVRGKAEDLGWNIGVSQTMPCSIISANNSQPTNAFRVGCRSFRLSNVVDHEKSPAHVAAVEAFEVSNRPLPEKPMEKCLQKLEKEHFQQMSILFRSAFY